MDRPLHLIALSSKNRFLLLTAPQLGVVAYFLVGFLRLIVTDPLTYLLGRQYDEGALSWVERKISAAAEGKSFVRKAERLFSRAASLFILTGAARRGVGVRPVQRRRDGGAPRAVLGRGGRVARPAGATAGRRRERAGPPARRHAFVGRLADGADAPPHEAGAGRGRIDTLRRRSAGTS